MTALPTLLRLSPAADRVIIAVNPCAGARAGNAPVSNLKEVLLDRGFSVKVVTELAEVGADARYWNAQGRLRAVVAAGGDGTIGAVVNHTDPGTPLAVFPLGTANLLAHYLRTSTDAVEFSQMIVEGAGIRLDAGRAGGRIFISVLGCGFDAEVVHRLHRRRAGHIRYWSYAKPIVESLRTYGYPEVRVYCDPMTDGQAESPMPISARWAFVANLPCYAANLGIVPQALGTDGVLDVCAFCRGSLWYALKYLGYVYANQHYRLADCTKTSAARLRIESDWPVPYQLDGDPGGMLPVNVEVVPQRLMVLAPAWRAAELASQGMHGWHRETSEVH